jgi:serine/threonine protein phosphatase 1
MPDRTIAIGDIHGCHLALEQVLRDLKISAGDTIIVLGDVVDRGPGTKQAVDQLLELETSCRLIFLMGNHEEMMLEAREGGMIASTWLRYGGQQTLDSYGGGFGLVPDRHWEFFQSGRDYWETESEIFVHANLEPGVELPAQSGDWLRWTQLSGQETPRECGRRVVCGHSSLMKGVPLVLDGWVCIDTRCYGRQYLSALDVTNDLVYQAKQSGEPRGSFSLADFPDVETEGEKETEGETRRKGEGETA